MSDDMGTMPIRDLIQGIRAQAAAAQPQELLKTMVFNVFANRLEELADENDRLKSPDWTCPACGAPHGSEA